MRCAVRVRWVFLKLYEICEDGCYVYGLYRISIYIHYYIHIISGCFIGVPREIKNILTYRLTSDRKNIKYQLGNFCISKSGCCLISVNVKTYIKLTKHQWKCFLRPNFYLHYIFQYHFRSMCLSILQLSLRCIMWLLNKVISMWLQLTSVS